MVRPNYTVMLVPAARPRIRIRSFVVRRRLLTFVCIVVVAAAIVALAKPAGDSPPTTPGPYPAGPRVAASYRLAGPTEAALVPQGIGIVRIAANEQRGPAVGEVSGAVRSANARFIAGGYVELLGRAADTTGLDFHLGRIAAGGDRTRTAFAYSLLFGPEGSRNEVRRAYSDILGRNPDAAGDQYWTDHLQGRGVLDLRVLLLSADEYHQQVGGTDAAWVDSLYVKILGRTADTDGRQYWLQLLQSGVPRPLVAAGLYLSDEALGRRVDAYYGEALGRTPSAGERAGAVDVIRRSGERGLRARLWGSDEVFERYLDLALA